MRVSVIGTGYVGLVTGVCLAQKGHPVTCVDVDHARVAQVNRGEVPFHEPGLAELLRRNLGRRFRATGDLRAAVLQSELTLIAVGTPSGRRGIDLGEVRAAVRQVGRALAKKNERHTVVIKSTVVPGTTDGFVKEVLEKASGKRAGRDFGLGMNPEFLSEGEAVGDFMRPDRIVLGGIDRASVAAMERLYEPFGHVPILRTNPRTAELIKYTSNALLALLISFSNEVGDLCETMGGVDCEDVMGGVHLSQYLTPRTRGGERVRAPLASFLRAGCGFGGSCLPKDVRALAARGRQVRQPIGLLERTLQVNARRPARLVDLLRRHIPRLDGVTVAVLGLSFKPGTDDLRESPAVPVVRALLEAGARVRLYDPVAMPAARRSGLFGGARFARSVSSAVKTARAALVVTAWPELRSLERLPAGRRRTLVVVDGRRLLRRERFARYEGIGLGAPVQGAGPGRRGRR